MEDEKLLPKPLTDLPLPEKEIPAHSGSASKGLTLRSYGSKLSIFRNKIFILFVVISFLAAFLIGGFVLGKNSNNSIPIPSPGPVVYEPTPDPTADWQTYEGDGFSFKYPSQYIIQDPIFSRTDWNLEVSPGEIIPGQMTLFRDNRTFDIPKEGVFNDTTFLPGLKDKTIESYEEVIIENKKMTKVVYSCGVDCQYHALIFDVGNDHVLFELNTAGGGLSQIFDQVLSTFKFTGPKLSCTPRPACFDSEPRCLMPETEDMCPPTPAPTKNGAVFCAQDAKMCPDGSYVSRTGPNCEFAACPE